MVKNPSAKKKRSTARFKGITAQNKKDLECILGCCSHEITNKKCLYWNKVVDADDPALEQMKLIAKIFGGK